VLPFRLFSLGTSRREMCFSARDSGANVLVEEPKLAFEDFSDDAEVDVEVGPSDGIDVEGVDVESEVRFDESEVYKKIDAASVSGGLITTSFGGVGGRNASKVRKIDVLSSFTIANRAKNAKILELPVGRTSAIRLT
jgi:hypothetical protein